jgi:uncharacterized protein
LDARLLDILVCPICKGPLAHERAPADAPTDSPQSELICKHDRLAFPVRDAIPRMLIDEARRLDDAPA